MCVCACVCACARACVIVSMWCSMYACDLHNGFSLIII